MDELPRKLAARVQCAQLLTGNPFFQSFLARRGARVRSFLRAVRFGWVSNLRLALPLTVDLRKFVVSGRLTATGAVGGLVACVCICSLGMRACYSSSSYALQSLLPPLASFLLVRR